MSLRQRKTVHRGRVLRLDLETVLLPDGQQVELEIAHHPGGAAVVALDEAGRVCLLRQYRHAAGGWLWEIPAGKLDPTESPEATAIRELAEEAGLIAQDWTSLGRVIPSPGVLTEVVHLFLARGLQATVATPEGGECLEVHWLRLEEAIGRVHAGEIEDGKTALALLRAAARLG